MTVQLTAPHMSFNCNIAAMLPRVCVCPANQFLWWYRELDLFHARSHKSRATNRDLETLRKRVCKSTTNDYTTQKKCKQAFEGSSEVGGGGGGRGGEEGREVPRHGGGGDGGVIVVAVVAAVAVVVSMAVVQLSQS